MATKNRFIATMLAEIVEEMLTRANITIPSKTDDESYGAKLYGIEYDKLLDDFEKRLNVNIQKIWHY